ncbi:MAG: T9SS type A sorting domain-containing protein [FCB group bacterium]
MKKILFVILLLILSSILSYSQSIIWEREYDLGDQPTCLSLQPTIIDSVGNIVSVLDPGYSTCPTSDFFKYNTDGILISYKKYFIGQMLAPVSIVQTDSGYKFFCATNNYYDKYGSTSIPIILNTDKNGDTTYIEFPYKVNENKSYDSASFNVNLGNNNNTISFSDRFYNASIKHYIKVDSITSIGKDHLIISCYDTTGKIIWRKGVDTLNGGDLYYFFDLKLNRVNKLLILACKYIYSTYVNIQIIEIDTDGNITKKIEFPAKDRRFAPRGIEELDSGNYIVLGQYMDNPISHLLAIINDNGDIIKKVDLPEKNISVKFNGVKRTPRGYFYLIGNTYIDSSSVDHNLDTSKLLLYKVNSQLDLVSDYEWCEYITQNRTGIRQIHFLDKDNFVVIGYKDSFKFYIAKFKDSTLTNVSDNQKEQNFTLFPNPVSDYLNLSFSINFSTEIKIYNELGIPIYDKKVQDENNLKIDTRDYPTGVYFCQIIAGGYTETKKFLVVK